MKNELQAKTVNIRVLRESRNRLKVMAAKQEKSLLEVVDEFSKYVPVSALKGTYNKKSFT